MEELLKQFQELEKKIMELNEELERLKRQKLEMENVIIDSMLEEGIKQVEKWANGLEDAHSVTDLCDYC